MNLVTEGAPRTPPARPRAEMIDPDRYDHLGELLMDALVTWKSEVAFLEVRRKDAGTETTYGEARERAFRIAGRLEAAGIGPDDRVAIIMGNQPAWLLTAMAVFFRGAVVVPIDYKLAPEDQAALVAHAGATLLVTEYGLLRRFHRVPDVPALWITEAPEGAALEGAERFEDLPEAGVAVPAARTRDDVAAIVYSSGTGGRPKGCVLTHGNYLSQLAALGRLFPMGTGDRYFSILPTNHAIDFMCGFLGPLSGGATVVHQRTLRPELVRDTMRRFRITHMALVPLVLEAFERSIREKLDQATPAKQRLVRGLRAVNALLTAKRPSHGLSRRLLAPVHDAFGGELRMVFCGGAFVDPDRAQFFFDLGIPVVIGYGLTEASTVVTVNDLKPFRPDTVGRAVPGVELEVRDPDPATGIGEVWVRGPTVMRGYLDDPEQTAEVLVDGWLRTGDLGWLDASHHLHLVGRRKNMIVTAGGKNIYPEDIEGAFEGLPVDELAVFAENYLFGGGALADERLVIVVRGGKGEAFLEELRARNRRLPDFKRVRGVLHVRDEFPRTASMKVKREALATELRNELDRNAVVPLRD